jgi:hypothetical protein
VGLEMLHVAVVQVVGISNAAVVLAVAKDNARHVLEKEEKRVVMEIIKE